MKTTLRQRFYFEAAHTLERQVEKESSRRIHGHTYLAEVSVSGTPDPVTGMLLDLGQFRKHLEAVRERLDHHLLDDVEGLGAPTLENLCRFIAGNLKEALPNLSAVEVGREPSGDYCRLEL